jgi:hypothetical protein
MRLALIFSPIMLARADKGIEYSRSNPVMKLTKKIEGTRRLRQS